MNVCPAWFPVHAETKSKLPNSLVTLLAMSYQALYCTFLSFRLPHQWNGPGTASLKKPSVWIQRETCELPLLGAWHQVGPQKEYVVMFLPTSWRYKWVRRDPCSVFAKDPELGLDPTCHVNLSPPLQSSFEMFLWIIFSSPFLNEDPWLDLCGVETGAFLEVSSLLSLSVHLLAWSFACSRISTVYYISLLKELHSVNALGCSRTLVQIPQFFHPFI